ncbi:MAG: thiamine phosphate synthase [Myxococcota bacterium]
MSEADAPPVASPDASHAPRRRGLPDEVAVVLVADAPTLGPRATIERVAEILAAVPRGSVLVLDRDRVVSRGGSSDLERFERAARLRELTSRHGACLVISGRADLAAAVGADGVQLPEAGLDAATVRRVFPALWVGRSCHDAAGLERAADDGADWAILAPVWAPLSKVATSPPLGLDGFGDLVRAARLPIVALGGVTADRAGALREAGARAVASLGGILQACEPKDAAVALVAAFRAAAPVDRPRETSDKTRVIVA